MTTLHHSDVCDVLTETLLAAARQVPDPEEFFLKSGPAVRDLVTQMVLRLLPATDAAGLQGEIAREYPRAFARARGRLLAPEG